MRHVSHLLISAVVVASTGLGVRSANAQWSFNGVKIFYTAGNVGVGTNNPAYKLDVKTPSGRGINILNQAASGTAYGVYSQVNSSAGRAIYGIVNNTTGTNYAIYGKVSSASGYAGYFTGGRNYFSGSVGIGTSNPAEKLHVEGTTRTKIIKIMGGADLAEPFDVSSDTVTPEPGHVVVIDPDNAGKLKVANSANDRRVAGIISGANGLTPGLVMKAEGNAHVDGDHPVALTGRVWCWCDASHGAIEPGDSLTTSTTVGHAMKVKDFDQSRGAILGKAMTKLEEGRGMVLVLVSLQ